MIAGLGDDDIIFGDDGNDTINGGAGNDTIEGNTGNDTVNAGDGDDQIIWRNGDNTDIVDGGAGTDTQSFVMSSGATGDIAQIAADISGNAVFNRTDLVPFTVTTANVERLDFQGLDGDDTLTVNSLPYRHYSRHRAVFRWGWQRHAGRCRYRGADHCGWWRWRRQYCHRIGGRYDHRRGPGTTRWRVTPATIP